MKECNKCQRVLSLSLFDRSKYNKDGLSYYCKECSRNLNINYKRTLKGLISKIYTAQKSNSKLRNLPLPLYSKLELEKYLINNDIFLKLYSEWKESYFNESKRPSVDRLDNKKGYSFDNIQICTIKQNRENFYLDKREGIYSEQSKAVLQYTLEGIFVEEFVSTSDAARKTNCLQSKISDVCLGKRNKTGGFIWKFKKQEV